MKEKKINVQGYLDQAFQSVRQKQILHFSKSSVINQSSGLQSASRFQIFRFGSSQF